MLEDIYAHLPIFMQNLACSLYGYHLKNRRYGSEFHENLERLLKSEFASKSDIEEYQNERLQNLIRHAYENVPYYREIMKSSGISPNDVKGRTDLQKLPLLTKEDVITNAPRILAVNASPDDYETAHTSGTTGKSLQFFISRSLLPFRWAVWWRHRMRFGIQPGVWHANFTGKVVVPMVQKAPPFWRINHPMQQILLNSHHFSPEKIQFIVEYLGSRELPYYSGYPSIIHSFARAALDAGLSLKNKPQYIFPGAENVLDFQRRDIESFTNALITDQYGFSEGCGNASQCTELVYHEDYEFGILECVDPEPAGDGRMRGKIVCTGFASPAFPFIRYEVGDIGVWESPDKECPCGRKSPILVSIEGRTDDYIITPEQTRIMRFDYVFKDTVHIRECQVLQAELGKVIYKIVRRQHYSSDDERELLQLTKKWISPTLQVQFEYVDEIPREANGKFRAVKSLL